MIYKILKNALTGNYFVYRTDHPIQVVDHKDPCMDKFMCSAVRKNKGIFIEWTRK